MEEKLDKIIDYMVKQFGEVRKELHQVREEAAEFRSEIWGHIDSVYKEVLTVRQEQAAHTGSHIRISDSVEDHEKRLKKLESSVLTTHTIKK